MIHTNKQVYATRGGELVAIFIEILAIQDDFKNKFFKLIIGDYIFDKGEKKYINDRFINLPYAQRDALKLAIVSQFQNGEINNMTESEVNAFILPYALLYFVTNDFIDLENQILIYNTQPTDWQIV